MAGYVERFRTMVKELERRDDIVITRAHIAPPVSADAITRVQQALGFELAPEILAFYREADGVSLRWIAREHEDFDPSEERSDAPFEGVPDASHSGLVHLLPLERVFLTDYQDVLWFDFQKSHTVEVLGEERDLLAFARALRPFDYYSEYNMAAMYIGDGAPDRSVLIGEDHGANWTASKPTDFANYLEGVLSLYGSFEGRAELFFEEAEELPRGPAWRERAPSLDELIEMSLA